MAIPRTHSYYAEAHALSGQLSEQLDPIAQVFLIGEGDGSCERNVDVEFNDVTSAVSVRLHAHARVSGVWDAINNVWITKAMSEIRGLNVSTKGRVIVAADLVSAVMTSVHHYDKYWYVPTMDFKLTYDGLKIDGASVTPVSRSAVDILGPTPDEEYEPKTKPKAPTLSPYLKEYLSHEPFLKKVKSQQEAIVAKSPPPLAKETLSSCTAGKTIRCSLVSDTGLSANAFGHVVEVPKIGGVFLGELTVENRFELNVLRLDLCTLGDGYHLIVGGPSTNGNTRP